MKQVLSAFLLIALIGMAAGLQWNRSAIAQHLSTHEQAAETDSEQPFRMLLSLVFNKSDNATAQINGEQTFRIPRPYRLADSTWPIYHGNSDATASIPTDGPGEVVSVQSVPASSSSQRGKPYVSPWTVVAEPYVDGSQAILTSPNDGLAKYIIDGDHFESVSFLPLDRRPLDFDWGILLLDNGLGIATEQKNDKFVIFGDASDDPLAPLEIKTTIAVDSGSYGKLTAHFSVAPDGYLVALTDANKLIAVSLQRKQVVASFDLPADGGTSFHNSFPIDELGRIYLSTQALMAAVDWDGQDFQLAWKATYDMRGPGCEDTPAQQSLLEEAVAVTRGELCTGTGTTPTLIGDQGSGVVVLVDGHAPQNNLLAFWRGEPPADWEPLADEKHPEQFHDAQLAAVFALPLSTPDGEGYTAENSPAALGNAIVVAQWAGFRPDRNPPKGVQRVDWNPESRRFELAWTNPDIHFNGVPTIACHEAEQCRAYGSGRYGMDYRYVALDFETGIETSRVNLGSEREVLDQGNGHAVAADGSILYAGRSKLVRIR